MPSYYAAPTVESTWLEPTVHDAEAVGLSAHSPITTIPVQNSWNLLTFSWGFRAMPSSRTEWTRQTELTDEYRNKYKATPDDDENIAVSVSVNRE